MSQNQKGYAMSDFLFQVFILVLILFVIYQLGSIHSWQLGLALCVGFPLIGFIALFLRIRYQKKNPVSNYTRCIACSDLSAEAFGEQTGNLCMKKICNCGAVHLITKKGIYRLDNNSGLLYKRVKGQLTRQD